MLPQAIAHLILFFIAILNGCECAASMFTLTSKRPKCFIIKSTAGSTIDIIYSTPDLVVLPADDSSSTSLQNRNSLQDPLNNAMDGLGAIKERMKSYHGKICVKPRLWTIIVFLLNAFWCMFTWISEKRQLMQKNTEKRWHTKTQEVVSNLSVTVENLALSGKQ